MYTFSKEQREREKTPAVLDFPKTIFPTTVQLFYSCTFSFKFRSF